MIGLSCDKCDDVARWAVYAAYPDGTRLPDADIRPVLRRYPMAMAAVCDLHLAIKLTADSSAMFATAGYYVTPVAGGDR